MNSSGGSQNSESVIPCTLEKPPYSNCGSDKVSGRKVRPRLLHLIPLIPSDEPSKKKRFFEQEGLQMSKRNQGTDIQLRHKDQDVRPISLSNYRASGSLLGETTSGDPGNCESVIPFTPITAPNDCGSDGVYVPRVRPTLLCLFPLTPADKPSKRSFSRQDRLQMNEADEGKELVNRSDRELGSPDQDFCAHSMSTCRASGSLPEENSPPKRKPEDELPFCSLEVPSEPFIDSSIRGPCSIAHLVDPADISPRVTKKDLEVSREPTNLSTGREFVPLEPKYTNLSNGTEVVPNLVSRFTRSSGSLGHRSSEVQSEAFIESIDERCSIAQFVDPADISPGVTEKHLEVSRAVVPFKPEPTNLSNRRELVPLKSKSTNLSNWREVVPHFVPHFTRSLGASPDRTATVVQLGAQPVGAVSNNNRTPLAEPQAQPQAQPQPQPAVSQAQTPAQPRARPRARHGPRPKSSPFKGVTYYKRTGRWEAHIWNNGKQTYLGSSRTSQQAARVYDRAAIHFRGRNAEINFPGNYDGEVLPLQALTDTELVTMLRKQSARWGTLYPKYPKP